MNHVVVYSEPGIYAGWPANHGSWQWRDEFLVGFIRGKYGRSSMHNVVGPLEKMLARSMDGGETWTVEKPDKDFDAMWSEPAPQFRLSDSIIRVSGNYDHGGDDCPNEGGFYLSNDRGKTWSGAYQFTGLEFTEPLLNTSRTCVVDDLVFLSARDEKHWGSDEVWVVKHDGKTFTKIGTVSDEKGRVVMPAAVRIGSVLFMVARRRGGYHRECWIDSYYSTDEGVSWKELGRVADTGGHNGNPPALIERNGKLFCAFADRSKRGMFYAVADMSALDSGWSEPQLIRQSNESDIGYPRLFKRDDGKLVCVYYWADKENKTQHIAASIF